MAKFVTIGERLSTTAPAVNKAFMERDPEPILKRAKQQLDAGAVYLDVNIGPAEGYGPDLMKWAVQLLQGEFDNVPLALDTSNKEAIEAGISVYNRSKGKPIVNSADAAGRIENIDLAAANDAIVSRFATAKESQKTTTSVWVTARCFWREVWSTVWKLRISGSIRCSWLLKECRTNRWKFLSASRCSLIWD